MTPRKRFENLATNLSQISAAVEMAFVRGFDQPDAQAVCQYCGHSGLYHGHRDLGTPTMNYLNWFVWCPHCMWASHTSELYTWQGDYVLYEFDYMTNSFKQA